MSTLAVTTFSCSYLRHILAAYTTSSALSSYMKKRYSRTEHYYYAEPPLGYTLSNPCVHTHPYSSPLSPLDVYSSRTAGIGNSAPPSSTPPSLLKHVPSRHIHRAAIICMAAPLLTPTIPAPIPTPTVRAP